jgi:hypothetical protein
MEHGFLILTILVLLFASIYGYSYMPVYFEKRREKRLKIEQARLNELYNKEKLRKQEIRDEKLNLILKRSAEIRKELQLLEQMKINRKSFNEDDMYQMKVDQMKKKQAV